MINLYKKINREKFSNFNELEILELIKIIFNILYNNSLYLPLDIMNENFENNIYNTLYDIIYRIYLNIDENVKLELDKIIKIGYTIYYSYVIPIRSFDNTFITKYKNNNKIKKNINYINNIDQPVQRTQEWYLFRHNTLTASNIWKCFGTDSVQNQLIYEKCQPYKEFKNTINTESPLHWGQKYEPVSTMYYELINNTKVSEYGCIPHNKYKYIAASPDGIIIDENNDLYGRMLEIKNIVNRKITGIPKKEYWIQMQIQMETCNLNECDFLETKFIEYDTYNNFINDGTFNRSNNNNFKGIIIYFSENSVPIYEYMPLDYDEEKFNEWENEIKNKNADKIWVRNIYWKLEKVSLVLVQRNKYWFKNALPIIENIWKIIEEERINGYDHRAPKKSNNSKKVNKEIVPKCMLDLSNII